jgi:hypothetical protein
VGTVGNSVPVPGSFIGGTWALAKFAKKKKMMQKNKTAFLKPEYAGPKINNIGWGLIYKILIMRKGNNLF